MFAAKSCFPHRWVQYDARRLQHYWMLDAHGRWRRFLQVWQMSVLAILLMPEACEGFYHVCLVR